MGDYSFHLIEYPINEICFNDSLENGQIDSEALRRSSMNSLQNGVNNKAQLLEKSKELANTFFNGSIGDVITGKTMIREK